MGGLAGAVSCALPPVAHAATAFVLPTATANRRFSVLYKGIRVGTHTISYSSATGETRVNTDIHLEVKLAFVTAYAFSHRSEETWRAGRLTLLTGETAEHGETLHVEGAATPQGFRVVSKSGPFIASAATLTSNSLWTPAMLEQATGVDAQRGGIIGVSARRVSDEQIVIAGGTVQATRYTFVTPYYAGAVWYDKANLWVGAEFERDGSRVQYQLET
jgi:hydrogenase maturation factor